MIDLRPVGYVIGLLVAFLGAAMLAPMVIDIVDGNGHWGVFGQSALITMLIGGLVSLASNTGEHRGLSLRQTFMLTTGVWFILPIFGALPFILGDTEARFVDAYFEAMSGLTTTGSTVFSNLETLPHGLLLWRGILQWIGGIGIIVVAMVFLPELRVGGMQIFRSEGFDTFGKILPRATEIAGQIAIVYLGLTVLCGFAYLAIGMGPFDAIVHAFTTIATGGFSNYDASFAEFQGGGEYVAALFMLLAALPFVRYVQLINGTARPLLRDSQILVFFATIAVLVIGASLALTLAQDRAFWPSFRGALFNVTSITTGTGYASTNYMTWGGPLVAMLFFAGLIGGCAGSTACSIKIFRYQLLFSAIRVQLLKVHSPNGVFTPRYNGRPIDEDALSSVMVFFVFFFVTLGLLAVFLGMTGLDFLTSISGAAAAIANIGPGLGDIIGPAGNFESLNDTAKWLLAFGMLVGRLELLAVFVLFTPQFWRA